MEENIKTRVRIYFGNSNHPSMSIQEFNKLKDTFQPNNGKLNIGDMVKVEGNEYILERINLSVLEETVDSHLEYGMELAITGSSFPYNFEVELFFVAKE